MLLAKKTERPAGREDMSEPGYPGHLPRQNYHAIIFILAVLLLVAGATLWYYHGMLIGLLTNSTVSQLQSSNLQANISMLNEQLRAEAISLNATQAEVTSLQSALAASQNQSVGYQIQIAGANIVIAYLKNQTASQTNTIGSLQARIANMASDINMQNTQVVLQHTPVAIESGANATYQVVPDFPGKLLIMVQAPEAGLNITVTSPNLSSPLYSVTLPSGTYTVTVPVIGTSANRYTYEVKISNNNPKAGVYNEYAINMSILN